MPDPIYGEEVVSYVVLRSGAPLDAEELLRYCATGAAAFQGAQAHFPRRLALPKTERGKLDRKALASRWKTPQP